MLKRAIGLIFLASSAQAACLQLPYDCVPDFGANPTITSVANGPWSNPATWSLNRVPVDGDMVAIAANTNVVYDVSSNARLPGVSVLSGGKLAFRPDVSTKLMVGNFLVRDGGELEIGTAANMIASNNTAEIVFLDQALDGVNDPGQYGTGLIVLGKATVHGAIKDGTFARLSSEPKKNQTSISVGEPMNGWRDNDEIAIPDTRQTYVRYSAFVPQWERRTVTVGANSVSFASALAFDHVGAHRADNSVEFFPHVANLTRNVRFRSENPAGVRGHTIFMDRAIVDIRYAEFRNLGRTTEASIDPLNNHAGRYPLHMCHLWGPVNPSNTGYQFKLVGNTVVDNKKWGIVLADSHFGLIDKNVVAFSDGAGYVGDVNNSSNEFDGNIVMATLGHNSPRNNDGRGGEGFYMDGWYNSQFHNNVAASGHSMAQEIVVGAGYKFFAWPGSQSPSNTRVALRRGGDMKSGVQGVDYTLVDMGRVPILEFDGNEAYGAMNTGLTIWNLGYPGEPPYNDSFIKNFRVWHMSDEGFFAYPIAKMTFDGFVVRGQGNGSGWADGDYDATDLTIRNADFQNVSRGFGGTKTGGTILIENSYMRVKSVGLAFSSLQGPGSGITTRERKIILKNVKIDPWPGSTIKTISANYDMNPGAKNFILKDELFVYDYQQTPGLNFQVYYLEQSASAGPIPPARDGGNGLGNWPGDVGPLISGLNNQQAVNAYPNGMSLKGVFYPVVAIAGGIARCTDTTTHPEIRGYVCAISNNQFPKVNAGPDQSIVFPPATTVSLDGTVTDDGLPSPPAAFTTTWTKASGPGTVTFGDANAADTTATFSTIGTYILRLTANDSDLTSYDETTITVKAPGSANSAPSVNAGQDMTVQLPSANLDGFTSDDGLPSPPGHLTLTWSQVSGPGTVTFADSSAAKTIAQFPVAGVYVLRLTADDGALFASQDMKIAAQGGGPSGAPSFGSSGGKLIQPPNVKATLPCSPGSAKIYQARNGHSVDAYLTANGNNVEWNGQKTNGDFAPAGVYMYVCDDKQGKLVLVK